jgi:hypothetical protein
MMMRTVYNHTPLHALERPSFVVHILFALSALWPNKAVLAPFVSKVLRCRHKLVCYWRALRSSTLSHFRCLRENKGCNSQSIPILVVKTPLEY